MRIFENYPTQFRFRSFLVILICASLLAACKPAPTSEAAIREAPKDASDVYEQNLIRANQLLRHGDLDEALAASDAARQLDPTRYEAEVSRAVILHASGRQMEARAALERAQQLARADQQPSLQKIARVVLAETASESANTRDASASAAAMSGPLRRQWDALLLIMEEADGAASDSERRQLLDEFLERSNSYSLGNPDHLPVWLLRAVAALELEREEAARQADRHLTRLGAEELEDPRIRQVLAMLQRRGWVEVQPGPANQPE